MAQAEQPGAGSARARGRRRAGQRPETVNPASGIIANWNNKPAAGWPAGDQREHWGAVHRVQGLTDGLAGGVAAGRLFTTESVNAIMHRSANADVFAARIAPFIADAVEAVPGSAPDLPRLVEAKDPVAAWMAEGAPLVAQGGVIPQPGAALYREFRAQVQRLVFGDELGVRAQTTDGLGQPMTIAVRHRRKPVVALLLPGFRRHRPAWSSTVPTPPVVPARTLGSALRQMDYPQRNEGNQEDDHGSFDTPDALFYRALQGGAAAVPLSHDYFDNIETGEAQTRDEVLVEALRVALGNLSARFGTDDMSQWREPQPLTTYMGLGAVGLFFGETTTERMNRGSFNLLVGLGAGGDGQIIVPPGESGALPAGSLGSEPPHLRDQLPLYEAFEYRAIPADRAGIEGPISTTVLQIPGDL